MKAVNGIGSAKGRLWTRWALDPALGICPGLLVEWRANCFTRVEPAARPPVDFKRHEISEALLTPGLLNAHAHLNYSGAYNLPRGSFARWLAAMIQQRRVPVSSVDLENENLSAGAALNALQADGVTEIWDIASFPSGCAAMLGRQTLGISFLEFIAPSAQQIESRWADWEMAWVKHQALCVPPLRPGASPHSLYSVSPVFWQRMAAWASGRDIPLALHLAESPEEIELFTCGGGALAEVLEAAGASCAPAGSGIPPLTHAYQAGLLGPATLAIHCNLPQPGEIELLARSGASVVCCPRSHAWFDYPSYPLSEYRAVGVPLALGTDSLASNDALSIRAELQQIIEHWKSASTWRPQELLGLATGALLGDTRPYGGRGRFAIGEPVRWALWQVGQLPEQVTPEAMLQSWLAAECLSSSAFIPALPSF